MKDGIKTPEEILEEAAAFEKSRILLTAVELKIFTHLSSKLLTVEELTEKISAEKNPLERLLNALVAMGYLRKTKGKFYNSKASEEYLVEDKEGFLEMIPHLDFLWDNWSNLTQKIKPDFKKPDRTATFIAAMHYRAQKTAGLLPYLLDLSDVRNMLDIGGGSGVFSYGIINAKPQIHSDILDLPEVIELTKHYAEKSGVKENISFIPGDFNSIALTKKYDLILISSVIHSQSHENNRKLISKCANALTENGQIVIRDYLLNTERTEPARSAIFSINMLVNTPYGDVYTKDGILEMLNEAGLQNVEFKEAGKDSTLVIARR